MTPGSYNLNTRIINLPLSYFVQVVSAPPNRAITRYAAVNSLTHVLELGDDFSATAYSLIVSTSSSIKD
ncbi:hypothetical protein H6F77_06825 [Microcoleus sp. FACHB-831]|uniref:hypothetical protein n=1 Tax=Microcoleus sp. FACHB-831 TaxID=2692827 RepID=UPI0016824241|nr:hypothetical protein [Microcoleus sp. FACHB-831]MBD1920797.1 hypothetical protein [Microcoleus sp. FACHB-831]